MNTATINVVSIKQVKGGYSVQAFGINPDKVEYFPFTVKTVEGLAIGATVTIAYDLVNGNMENVKVVK